MHLHDEIPSAITVTKIGDYWYLTSTHGDGDNHSHQEIRLDLGMLGKLHSEVCAAWQQT